MSGEISNNCNGYHYDMTDDADHMDGWLDACTNCADNEPDDAQKIERSARLRRGSDEEDLEAAAKAFEDDVETHDLTPEEAARLEKARRGRPRRGEGAQRVNITIERGLLKEADRLAELLDVSRSGLVSRAVRALVDTYVEQTLMSEPRINMTVFSVPRAYPARRDHSEAPWRRLRHSPLVLGLRRRRALRRTEPVVSEESI